jgi:hypothetical protein
MSERKPDFFHTGKDWTAVPVPGTGTMMLVPPDWVASVEGGSSNGSVACPWCGCSTVQDAVCDGCGSPLPEARSSFWSLLEAAS